MNKWIKALFDHRIDLQERTFHLVGIFGLLALVVMSLLSIIMRESVLDILLIYAGLVVFWVIFALSLRFHRVQTGATVISCILIFVMLPGVFVASGGMYGGTPMWFLFGAIFVSMVVRGRRRIIFLISIAVVLSSCYLIQWFYPDLITPHTARMAYTDSLASTLIVGVFVSLMVIFETNLYVEEQRIAAKTTKQIEEINRAQNRFFSNMSHEIRTPVNTIIGLNEMIMREAVTADVAEDARSIQGAGQMLLALINDILDMSKIESGKMELVPNSYSVGNMIAEVVNMIWSPAREKGLELHVDVDETMPRSLIGDDIRIKQILINLLNNAVKYTREGSVTFSVECRRRQTEKKVDLICTVIDTGSGIKKESMPMLFDVFRRVDEQKNRYIEGTGLGLSIVKQLVDLMGGEITVDSVYTKGSTFRVRIPQIIAEDEAIGKLTLRSGRQSGESDTWHHSFEAPGAYILIVDDNELNASVAAKLLQDTKMHIDTAFSGADCLTLTQDHRYDVILMDHVMPDMDGIETLGAIREQKGGMNRTTPVIVLTANAGSENQALYRRSGFDGYLLKPVTGAQLEGAVMDKLPQQLLTFTGIATVRTGEEKTVDVYKRKDSMVITVDSVCDLPEQMLSAHRIGMLPYRIRTQEGIFIDYQETGTGEALAYLGKNPDRTIEVLSPTIGDYEEFFAGKLLHADHVFHLTTSAGGEQAYRNASEAAHSFGNVTVIDTGQLSGGIGMLAILASRITETENLPPAALESAMRDLKKQVRTFIAAESTNRFLATGRITPRFHTICQSFMLRPIFTPRGGKYGVRGFAAGPRRQYLTQFISKTIPSGGVDRSRLLVISPNLAPEDRGKMEQLIRRKTPFEEVIYLQASAATSLIWGPNAIAFVYLMKS
ncbi:MAG: DegV family protein [Lachnospiraceae bacterium]|nr:DegV family protein [Lachnospiraceae bacterium]